MARQKSWKKRPQKDTQTQAQQGPQQETRPQPRQEPSPQQSIPPRLLPWPAEDGKPCYLVSNEDGGYLSRLADGTEAEQLETGVEVLGHARKLLDDPQPPYAEVRYAGIRLAECLSDALRIAKSRGMRLPAREPEREPGSEPEPDDLEIAGPAGPSGTGRTGTGGNRPPSDTA